MNGSRLSISLLNQHGWIVLPASGRGVSIQPVTRDIREALGIGDTEGALVAEVVPGSPADQAGLKPGDVIVALDGEPVESPRELSWRVSNFDPEAQARLALLREGERQTVEIRIGAMLERLRQASTGAVPRPGEDAAVAGLDLAPLTDPMRRRFGIDGDTTGALVTGVDLASAAAQRGLRLGDVIVQAGGQPVDDPRDVAEAARRLREQGRDNMLVLLKRQGQSLFVPLPIEPGVG